MVTGVDLRVARQGQGESTRDPLHDSELAPNSANGSIPSLIAWTVPKPPGNAATVSAFRPDHARPDAALSTMRAIDVPRCQVFPAGPAPDLPSGRTTTAHQGQKHLPATPPKGSGRSSAMPGSTPTSGDMASKDATVPMSLGARVATLVAILGPLVGLAVAVALFWGGLHLGRFGAPRGHVSPDGFGHHRRLPPAVRPSVVRDEYRGEIRPRGPRVDGRPGVASEVGRPTSPPPPAQRQDGRPPHPAPPRPRHPRLAQGLLACPHRLVLRARARGAVPLRPGPRKEPCPACGKRPLPLVDNPRPPHPGRPRRTAIRDQGGRLDWLHLGRAGPHLPRPPRDLERQLGLPPVGPQAVPERRREPEQRRVRGPGLGRGVAQHPPRVPDLGPPRASMVAD